jgi:hypothetical protein
MTSEIVYPLPEGKPPVTLMQSNPTEFRLMVAPAADRRWVRAAEEGLAPLPVDLVWSRSVDDAIQLQSDRPVHAAFVDDALPAIGGLELLRRFRRLGWSVRVQCAECRHRQPWLRRCGPADRPAVLSDGLAVAELKPARGLFRTHHASGGSDRIEIAVE